MGRYLYRIVRDVTGEGYDALIEACLEERGTFALVWRDQLRFQDSAQAIRAALRPLQVRQKTSDRWPGTRLIGHHASVITYRSDKGAADILRRPGSLFGWLAPDYPEDLFFVSPDEVLLLATVSHERQGWILSQKLARAVGHKVTLERRERAAGDEELFESAI